jgi:hypothetical protein
MPKTLRFGIKSLDKLIGTNKDGKHGLNIVRRKAHSADTGSGLAQPGHADSLNARIATSICLIGPDGTGKSVLALHLAAQYMADCKVAVNEADRKACKQLPKVFYISTDLTHSMAREAWGNFDLLRPFLRKDPFATGTGSDPDTSSLKLLEKTPKQMNQVLANRDNRFEVYFVDLAQSTAGDDWGFVHRLLSVLDMPVDDTAPRDLLLLDAVEGFETLVGDINAFGDKSTRRSRIAQVMRLAANKCHLFFVVEEVKQERLPEEFVTDAVIRLRNVDFNGYVRRTVEIEKTRGQTHVRGQHPFVIREGSGSTTGNAKYENHDDPRVLKHGSEQGIETQSYVQVFPSINNLSRELMEQRGDPKMERPKGKYAAFGIPYLDTILGGDGELGVNADGSDTRGLFCSSVTALIGDALTSKSLLGRAFLSRAFYPFTCALANKVKSLLPLPPQEKEQAAYKAVLASFEREVRNASEELKKQEGVNKILGVALMMTTQDTDVEALANEFIQWLNPKSLLGIRGEGQNRACECFEKVLQEHIEENTICRRMEVHDLSSPVLAHIFRRNIEAAQMKLLGVERVEQLPYVSARYKESWRIRLVMDDFNAFRNTFPDIHNDPLLLPFILLQLGREGISTLIIDTQSGKPDIALSERFESSLRETADHRLYTWRIPFYGETRIAITAIPPLSMKSRGLIRELSGQGMQGNLYADDEREDRQLTVDPHFELYAGLERGHPHPVPLEVRLYPGTKTLVRYIEEENVFFKEMFMPNVPKTDIIVGFDPPSYESLREFCYLQRDTRLDHTLVFQVDEFWLTWLTRHSRTRKGGVLQRQWPYLNTVTVDRNGEPDPAADAYHLFQETFDDMASRVNNPEEKSGAARTERSRECRRRNFYDDERLAYGFNSSDTSAFDELDRVPFLWDFAFLLCREDLWKEYIATKPNTDKVRKHSNVKEVWENIPKAKNESLGNKSVSWHQFLEACREVAEYHSARTSTLIPAFDFSMNDGESFSCLLLELWASETYESRKQFGVNGEKRALTFARRLSQKKWNRGQVKEKMSLLRALSGDQEYTLGHLLYNRKHRNQVTGYSLELYKAWLLLTEVINFNELVSTPDNLSFEFKSRQSNPQAVAAHHWYQSACDLIDQNRLPENLVAVRLPGHFSVRGDWFLAAAGGSRSGRLAQRAFDLLSSRRANIKRLQLGLGLPVRKIVSDKDDFKNLRTRLISTDYATGRLDNVSYENFLKIKGKSLTSEFGQKTDDEFYWLWRSSLYGYARYSKVWQKWLNRMAIWWHTIFTRHKTGWTPGFEVYRKINNYLEGNEDSLESFDKYESWREFHRFRNILLTDLRQVSFGSR